jgi:HSP20 family protein
MTEETAMLLNRITPIATFGRLSRDMDRLFDEVFNGNRAAFCRPGGFPAMNVWEDGDTYVVEAEVPGMTMENLNVEVLGNELHIGGERKDLANENANVHRRERSVGMFRRTLSLPTDIDATKVEATLKDGVLAIRLPKAEAAKVRRIEVKPHE